MQDEQGEMVMWLLDGGTDVTGRMSHCVESIIWFDANNCSSTVLRQEIELKKQNLPTRTDFINEDRCPGLIQFVARNDNIECLKLWLDHGADPSRYDGYNRTALMEDFLESNDDMDGQGSSALGAASTSSLSWETVKRTNRVFLENGDDINFTEATIPDSTNKDPGFDRPCALPLYDFASAGSIEGAKLLLEHGADPTAKGLSGRRPMHAVLDANDLDPALAERIFTIIVRASDE
ncbi:hypothetical protein BDV23DRAFT_179047 [Aspergillus alliaceus]|uniref:Ankyrin repeat-containing domain protein n=1 Tax=Petromyces alliaceus TaxID=209559 RepID=A0A5N7CMG1_PETAA|nr:hypothetical protein BDV23DRAFT_179047 [Aspergillus alliaceus]